MPKRATVGDVLLGSGPSLLDLRVLRGTDGLDIWRDLLSDVRTKALLHSTTDPIVICDAYGKVLHLNPPAESLFQAPREEIVNLSIANLIAVEHRDHIAHMLENSRAREGSVVSHEQTLDAINAHGEPIAVELRMLTGRFEDQLFHCCVFRNVADPMSQDTLLRLADHDPLTGLFNRRRFCLELEQQLKVSHRYGVTGSLLFIDLDCFKEINDSLGHEAGDDVLRRFSEILTTSVRKTDVVGRLGGDEFAILLTRSSSTRAAAIADEICQAVRSTSIPTGGREVRITASIGVASFPEHATTEKDLFACADLAMYRTKERGRNGATLFTPRMRSPHGGNFRILWEERIRRALQDDTFFLVLQPIQPLHSGLSLKYESLLRLRAGDGTVVSPGEFLPIAERYGMIVDVDRWVLDRVLRGLARGSVARFPSITMNLSAQAVGHQGVLDDLKEAHASGRIDPTRLTLEITEAAVIADFDKAREFLEEVRRLGVRVAIDDFGTGFSSLARLRELNVDYLKVAMPFIKDLAESLQERHLVKAVVEMAQGLGQQTIAEGVETAAVLTVLEALGVDYAQGYFISKPLGGA